MVKGAGWRFFAGTVLGIAGIMRFFDAIWAFRYNGALPDNLQDALFGGPWTPTAGSISSSRSSSSARPSASWSALSSAAGSASSPARHGDQRDLVDAVLPDLVSDLHRPRRPRHLRAGRLRRQGVGRTGRGSPKPLAGLARIRFPRMTSVARSGSGG